MPKGEPDLGLLLQLIVFSDLGLMRYFRSRIEDV